MNAPAAFDSSAASVFAEKNIANDMPSNNDNAAREAVIADQLRLGIAWENLGENKSHVRSKYNKSSWGRALLSAKPEISSFQCSSSDTEELSSEYEPEDKRQPVFYNQTPAQQHNRTEDLLHTGAAGQRGLRGGDIDQVLTSTRTATATCQR